VTFNGEVLSNWEMYPLNFTNLFEYFDDSVPFKYRHVHSPITCCNYSISVTNCSIVILLMLKLAVTCGIMLSIDEQIL